MMAPSAAEMHEEMTLSVSDRIGRIVMQTRDGLNGYTRSNLLLLTKLIRSASESDADFVIISAKGVNFCIGASAELLMEMLTLPEDELEEFIYNGQEVIRSIVKSPKVFVAHVNGFVAGGGVDLMLACDLAFLGEAATVNLFYSKLGVLPDHGSLYFLDQRFGMGAGQRHYILNDRMDSKAAIEAGWANASPPLDDSPAGWRQHLARVLRIPLSSFVALKRAKFADHEVSFNRHLRTIARLQASLITGEDQRHRISRVAALQAAKRFVSESTK